MISLTIKDELMNYEINLSPIRKALYGCPLTIRGLYSRLVCLILLGIFHLVELGSHSEVLNPAMN